jgi:hypothetical protein
MEKRKGSYQGAFTDLIYKECAINPAGPSDALGEVSDKTPGKRGAYSSLFSRLLINIRTTAGCPMASAMLWICMKEKNENLRMDEQLRCRIVLGACLSMLAHPLYMDSRQVRTSTYHVKFSKQSLSGSIWLSRSVLIFLGGESISVSG